MGRKYSRQCGLKVKDFTSVVLLSRAVAVRKKQAAIRPLTVHQIVAYNFRRAREEARWTQTQTSEQLEPLLGYRLNQAGVSAIERTFDSGRRRNIDVAEVVAFARCFGRPIGWFFIPPPGHSDHVIDPIIRTPALGLNMNVLGLIHLVLGTPDGWEGIVQRVEELIETDAPLAQEALEFAIDDRNYDLSAITEDRRRRLQDVVLARRFSPTDVAVQKLADSLLELMKLTPEGFRLLNDQYREEALERVARFDRRAKEIREEDKAEIERRTQLAMQGKPVPNFDDDPEEADGPDTKE